MSALEKSMLDMAQNHGLVHFAINLSGMDGHCNWRWFSVSAQWLDDTQEHGRGIASGNGKTIAEAMTAMMRQMAERRASQLADEALPSVTA